MDNKQGMWVPLLASVGVGAAAYYSMTRGQGIGKIMQQAIPFASSMGNTSAQSQQSQQPTSTYQTNQLQ
ncbi:hypothetical protein NC797_06775 [Aquibacillus sp. 3ASR75-11]|uniref:Uncharacterized protein n=1 Tax=Terrihalobacillus insolitus TaxID=2950438 RepID=A0A9X4AN64_9BACI|nr:hypothetical protein [Terrihalobacillus insolitus]MDC3414677.1 hypothetical protein [Terrihalobacillus insolitus]MDC3424210.1 hypothetical protein [Terrihalobacillus insolitus]